MFSEAGEVVGLIDWEMSAPAPASNDIAHIAWWWVPLVHPALSARMGAPLASDLTSRLTSVSDAFAMEAADLVHLVRDYIRVRLAHAQRGLGEGDVAFVALERRGYLSDLAATLKHLAQRS